MKEIERYRVTFCPRQRLDILPFPDTGKPFEVREVLLLYLTSNRFADKFLRARVALVFNDTFGIRKQLRRETDTHEGMRHAGQ